ncbi:heptaprenylglyceryl phosphate synthase [Ectobacillus antri]|jgi:putative glycerol-1-phosphate prenyltransferase|uniref:Heptaprenylglyceryl phosphate synthase n=1 Tax=Ectobacillus antri TaxID=2486280 RepID=A0ABT6HAM3_9BACI|nr:heptaprenylglyceryl phosphate synthase [Ectobacillus antri]MDG4658368.1 heptaprenylglyceryl phosphate synthase [Ectobacillus antri]MDG5755406.1 heptaprenylglyceryl phosphate synthase [Ectobacillus antri]
MYDIKQWKHVFKLDPNKEISEEDLEKICESGTDAILVGGSDGVTLDNVLFMLSSIRRYTVPCVLEVSSLEAVTPGFDYYYIPSVLNSRNPQWITGLQYEALKEFGDIMNWDEIFMEGYCVLNPDSKVAALTEANCALNHDEVIAYARLADKLLRLPIFYLEYSGTYGDPELVKKVKRELESAHLYYGGGISTKEQAAEMAQYADTVVVGNLIYTDVKEALRTVQAVKGE